MTTAGARSIPGAPGLAAEYEMLHELGRGGTAVVYLARERTSGREVAIKVIRATYAEDEEVLARFAREASVAERLQHPRIVPVHAVRQLDDGTVALVMERVPGQTLKETIRHTGPLQPARAEAVLRDIATALGHAHAQGIVHRDVKPENIFIDETTGHALLSDFGIARPIQGDTALTLTGIAIGTPTYMSPEQIDRPDIDGRSDLYSLGLVGWEMLSGTRPWDGESLYGIIFRQKQDALPPLDALRSDVPERLLVAIEGLLEKDRDVRWSSADEFLAQLSAEHPAPRRPRPLPMPTQAAPTETIQYRRPPSRSDIEMLLGPQRPAARRRGLLVAALVGIPASLVAVALLLSTRSPHAPGPELALAAESSTARPDAPSTSDAARGGARSRQGVASTSAGSIAASDRARPVPDSTPPPSDSVPAQMPRSAVGEQAGGDHATRIAIDHPPAASRTPPVNQPVQQSARRDARTPASAGRSSASASASSAPPTLHDETNTDSATDAAASAHHGTVIAGGVDSCLLTPSGAAYCWGGNDQGQLGTGNVARAAAPAAVAGDVHFASISPGLSHTCAIARDGASYCWGANDHGQLGNGSVAPSTAPARVAGHWRFQTVQAGIAHSCALGGAGRIYCWGAGSSGELGNGHRSDASTPVPVAGRRRFATLAVGWNHSCALDDAGAAYCWGDNSAGQLGDGTTADRDTPTAVGGGLHFVAIAAGGAHSCAVTAAGVAYCWGRNQYGELGDGTTTSHTTPTPVAGDHRFSAITAGGVHTCAITRDGGAECWGRNSDGQLGDGTTVNRTAPVPVDGDHRFATIHTTGAHTCATTRAGESFCWGYNIEGQLGDGTRTHRMTPVSVAMPNG